MKRNCSFDARSKGQPGYSRAMEINDLQEQENVDWNHYLLQGNHDRRRCWLRDCGSDHCVTSISRAFHYRFVRVRLTVLYKSSSPPFRANVTGLNSFSYSKKL